MGTISGELTTERVYTSPECKTHLGSSLVVIKKHEGAKRIILRAMADGFKPAEIEIK
jgi:hypothetical protein